MLSSTTEDELKEGKELSVTERLAQAVVETDFGQMPPEAISLAKQAILDCLGVTLAGSVTPTGQVITEFVKELGGEPQAIVLGSSFRTSAPNAALANGTMAHALDYDDGNHPMYGHPSAPVLPVVLALGEKQRVSGKEVLEAYLLGFEVEVKLGREMNMDHYEKGWHATGTLGTMGATTAAAKILKLNVEKTRTAFGIAVSLAAGTRANFGTMTKPFHAGNAARNGIVAATLAHKGFTANLDGLDGPWGFSHLLGNDALDLSRIVGDFGNPFEIVHSGVTIKQYPCCGGSHPSIDAIFHLVDTYGFSVEDVRAIECGVSQIVPQVLAYPEPTTGLEAKFSLQYCVAVALLDRKVRLDHFTNGKVDDAEIRELLKRITMYVHSDVENDPDFASIVTVKLRDGREYSHRVDKARGRPSVPLSKAELHTKYRDCARGALHKEDIERSLKLVENLETLEDITVLVNTLLVPPNAACRVPAPSLVKDIGKKG